MAAAFAAADPAHAADYRANLARFQAGLQPAEAVIRQIQASYHGVPVAYTERLPGYLLAAAGLSVQTPPGFARSIENGNEPSPADSQAFEQLITGRQVRVLLYNSQVTSSATQHLRDLAAQNGVPVVGVSETLPAGLSYQAWQLQQARALLEALGG
jgi:zinc/manganese transport system substrate-binding protein